MNLRKDHYRDIHTNPCELWCCRYRVIRLEWWVLACLCYITPVFTAFWAPRLRWHVIESCVLKATKTLNSGYLGSRNDEERSEMRYVMWIAEFSESSKLWTHIALVCFGTEYASFSVIDSHLTFPLGGVVGGRHVACMSDRSPEACRLLWAMDCITVRRSK